MRSAEGGMGRAEGGMRVTQQMGVFRQPPRAKSNAESISKMGIVEEEADESLFWMELLVEAGLVDQKRLEDLMKEADELIAIVVSSINTAKKKASEGGRK